jgi:hypothetical protein
MTRLDVFAETIGKHSKTVKKLNPPVVYVGRTPYVPDDQGQEWVKNGCKPLDPTHRCGRKAAA